MRPLKPSLFAPKNICFSGLLRASRNDARRALVPMRVRPRFDGKGGEKPNRINQPERQNDRSRAEPERGDRTRQSEQRQIIRWSRDDQ